MKEIVVTVAKKKEPISSIMKEQEKKKYNILVRFKNPFSYTNYVYATFMFEGVSEINARCCAEVYLRYLLDSLCCFEILEIKEVK